MAITSFPEMLKRLREAKGMSGNRLCAEAGIDRALYTKLESGKRHPTDEVLEKLAAVLGEPYERLRAWAIWDRLSSAERGYILAEEGREVAKKVEDFKQDVLPALLAQLQAYKEEPVDRTALKNALIAGRADESQPVDRLPVFPLGESRLPHWIIPLAEEWQPWPEKLTHDAESIFEVVDHSLALYGIPQGTLLLVRLPEEEEEPIDARVLVKQDKRLVCKRFRRDAMGAYLEALTIQDTPWRTPMRPETPLFAVVIGAYHPG